MKNARPNNRDDILNRKTHVRAMGNARTCVG